MILLSHRGWTAVAIAELLGCDPSTVRRWIHRYNQHGVAGPVDRPRPGRPRLGSPKLAKLPAGTVVLAEDETHVNLLPWVRATWIPHGQRQEVMTPGKNRRRTIFGAVDLAFGARSSPHDNPVERIWGALKAWLANSPTLTIQGRVRQVHAFFRARTRSRC
jgi:hypothetical protein